MLAMIGDTQPSLIILDLHLSDHSGTDDLKMIRARGYGRRIIVLSSPSMMSVINEIYASGVDRVLKAPVAINGRYDLGELRSTVKSCLQDHAASARLTDHVAIAQRAYELYEAGGSHEGSHLQHWLQAEREVAMR
jgi:response regulator of citrate/malate metabolism